MNEKTELKKTESFLFSGTLNILIVTNELDLRAGCEACKLNLDRNAEKGSIPLGLFGPGRGVSLVPPEVVAEKLSSTIERIWGI